MKGIAQAAGVVALVLLVVAFIGRFSGTSTVMLGGKTFAALSLVVMANTALLVGIYARLMGRRD